ncbi:hypothetical protein J0S82_003042 [Galemys pyrenaicus]|uniref:Uncharacterized protein n=1 Tax=Galemys pyrenaicus TaxID=202257 RepID=A0A8J6A3Y9_GALPY|nr:hypothetical protein J0S82_003042 [Galemys pyrenaicus]
MRAFQGGHAQVGAPVLDTGINGRRHEDARTVRTASTNRQSCEDQPTGRSSSSSSSGERRSSREDQENTAERCPQPQEKDLCFTHHLEVQDTAALKATQKSQKSTSRRYKLDRSAIIRFALPIELAMEMTEENTFVFMVEVKAN